MVIQRLLAALILPLTLGAPALAAQEMQNRLAGHPSPYLALHGDDPVAWQAWDHAAIERARAENKPLFVSVGYFACHWCHVMQQESFKDSGIAEQLNEAFIPVKVDRELEPVLDARLLYFLEATAGIGGWPLNVFVTPEGYPLTGLVYMPPAEFSAYLDRLSARWGREGEALSAAARQANAVISQMNASLQEPLTGAEDAALIEGFVATANGYADPLAGGFGDQSKFPSVPQLMALLELADDAETREFLVLTLERMADYGLRDHLAGGFFRYTVDPAWQIPHFEKMLYDNALLAQLYLAAGERLARVDFTAVGLDTLAFMRSGLSGAGGALIASLSAVDDKNVEGGYYLWGREQVRDLLTPEQWAVAELGFSLDTPPILEYGHLPVRGRVLQAVAGRLGMEPAHAEALLEEARQRLLLAREARGLPQDDKRLAGWNGLALSAFAAGLRAGDPASRDAGAGVAGFIARELWNAEQGLSRAVTAEGRSLGPGQLEDYAYVAGGLVDWARATGGADDRALATAVTRAAWARFHGEEGWVLTDVGLLPGEAAQHHMVDSPLPSPSATLLAATRDLVALAPDATLERRLDEALAVRTQALVEEPFVHATQLRLIAAVPKARVGASSAGTPE
jgi:uncharacterized protein YyaL (SSP411 family)